MHLPLVNYKIVMLSRKYFHELLPRPHTERELSALGVPSAESSRSVRGLGKGGPGASGRVLPPDINCDKFGQKNPLGARWA